MLPVLLLGVFIGTFGLAVTIYTFLNGRVLGGRNRARRRIQADDRDANLGIPIWRDSAASAIPALNKWLNQLSHTDWLRQELRTAGLPTRPGVIMLAAALLGLAAYILGATLFASLILAVPLGLLGAAAPYGYVRWRKQQRLAIFDEQLPDAMDALVNGMRAGYSFQAAMEFVGREMPPPIGTEFARFFEEQRLGVDVRTALMNLLDRVRSIDLKFFATAVLIQRETGGNLGEVLTNISTMLRERYRIKGELRTVTSQARLSAKILGVLPAGMAGVMFITSPQFVSRLYGDPLGRTMLAAALIGQVLGFVAMNRLADIEF